MITYEQDPLLQYDCIALLQEQTDIGLKEYTADGLEHEFQVQPLVDTNVFDACFFERTVSYEVIDGAFEDS